MSSTVFRRHPRRPGPQAPEGELRLKGPPELPETIGGGLGSMLFYLPMLVGGATMAFLFIGTGSSPITMVAGVMYALSMVGMMVAQFSRGTSEKKRSLNAERRDYARYLSQVRTTVRRAAADQREALLWHAPPPQTLWSVALSSRLWERRPDDPDFGDVRLAVGRQRLALSLVTPQTKPVEDLEPLSAGSLRRFVRAHSTVPELPVSVSVRAFARILVSGPGDRRSATVRAVLAQLAVFHSPDDLRIVICAPPERAGEWDWVKWLPHALHPTAVDAAGPVRLFAPDLGRLETLLPDLARRSRFAGAGTLPHYVVVVDGVPAVPSAAVLPAAPSGTEAGPAVTDLDGVTILDLDGRLPPGPESAALRLELDGDEVHRVARDRVGTPHRTLLGRVDTMSVAVAEALARQLAPLRPSVGVDADLVLSRDLGLAPLLGLGDPAALEVATTWRPRPPRDYLRVPIGIDPSGEPVELDIKEAAQGGMGPHGLLVGATGSGKSELLRTLVLGLAITHPTQALNFVLVDFKGGATFARLEDLPHTSAVITNLEDDLSLVDRMRDAIDGELNRRQEVLREAGAFASLRDYDAARASGAPLAPLPTLFIVVDEFSELLSAKPDLIDLFVTIGRIGRSLGVHLLLASQRLEEGRLRGLDTYLSYRIGLRTFSAMESRVVLGVSDAYELPGAPGHGYLKIDTSTMVRFRAAYVSGPYHGRRTSAAGVAAVPDSLTPYDLGYHPPVAAQTQVAAPDGPVRSVLEVTAARLVGRGAPGRRVWLPPLDAPATLAELLPPLVEDPVRGLGPADRFAAGRLRVPIGLVDKPYHQRRDPLLLDLSGAGGHVAVVGAPQSGKSTVLRDLIAALALTHTPAEVQFSCLDFGGGSLAALDGLPHVGSVAGRLAPERVRRTIAEITGLLERRERLFHDRGIDSMATYRRLCATEGDLPEDPGDVFLVIDGWGTLRTQYEALEAQITAIAARGLGYGIHVVISAQRWMEIRPALKDLIGTRIELRLGDPMESDIDRRAAANVPRDMPGRGLTPERLHLLAALPRLDADRSPHTLAAGLADLVDRVARAWTGPSAPAVRLLPTDILFDDLPPVRSAVPGDGSVAPTDGRFLLPIGVDEEVLATVALDLRADPHLTVFGDARCGKSNLLRLICHGIAERFTPDQAKIIVIDYRHGLLDSAGLPHTLAHGFAANHTAPIIANVVEGLDKRLPPPDITADRLRARDWWHGPELFLVIDDYDLVVTGTTHPLLPLLDLIPLARDIGLHLVVARAAGGAGRALFEPVLQRLRETGSPALVMSGPPEEGALVGGIRPEPLPPGRGWLATRRGARLLQTARLPLPADDLADRSR